MAIVSVSSSEGGVATVSADSEQRLNQEQHLKIVFITIQMGFGSQADTEHAALPFPGAGRALHGRVVDLLITASFS